MYRQLLIQEKQRHLQQIVWRLQSTEPLNIHFTHSYLWSGGNSLLGNKVSFQTGRRMSKYRFPKVDVSIREGFYGDNLQRGTDSIEKVSRLCKNIYGVLRSGCFDLRKWHFNEPYMVNLLDAMSQENFRKTGDQNIGT